MKVIYISFCWQLLIDIGIGYITQKKAGGTTRRPNQLTKLQTNLRLQIKQFDYLISNLIINNQ